LTDNLLFKYKTLYNENIRSGKLQITWDNNEIEQRLRTGKKLTAKLSIEFGSKRNTILGSIVPFKIKGDKKLIKTGYECGFGDMNSLGFGMVDIGNEKNYQ
jgi:CRISPR-associated endoribonuclease Cas6